MLILALIATLIIPSIVWGYIFNYDEEASINRKNYLIGLIFGGFAVLSVVIINHLLKNNFSEILNPFIALGTNNIFNISILSSLSITTILMSVLSIILLIILTKKTKSNIKTFIGFNKNFMIGLVIISFFVFFMSIFFKTFPALDANIGIPSHFGEITFGTIKLIVFYYIIVAVIEEASKYFHYIASSYSDKQDIKKSIIISMLIAFGFSVIENMIYTYNLYQNLGASAGLFSTILLRSIFSTAAHILFSSVISYYFLKEQKKGVISINIITGILISIALHTLYDVGLSTNYLSWIPVIYLIGTYLFITKIMYYDREFNPEQS